MLGAIQAEQATSIVDSARPSSAYGLDKPRLQVVLREAGKEVAALKFGNDSQTPAGVYLQSPLPTIVTVTKDLHDKLNVKWDDLLEAPPGPETAPK
jgi:hypothetical protein